MALLDVFRRSAPAAGGAGKSEAKGSFPTRIPDDIRQAIEVLLDEEFSDQEIADEVGVHRTTVSRVRRRRDKGQGTQAKHAESQTPSSMMAELAETTKQYKEVVDNLAGMTQQAAPLSAAPAGRYYEDDEDPWERLERQLDKAAATQIANNPDMIGRLVQSRIERLIGPAPERKNDMEQLADQMVRFKAAAEALGIAGAGAEAGNPWQQAAIEIVKPFAGALVAAFATRNGNGGNGNGHTNGFALPPPSVTLYENGNAPIPLSPQSSSLSPDAGGPMQPTPHTGQKLLGVLTPDDIRAVIAVEEPEQAAGEAYRKLYDAITALPEAERPPAVSQIHVFTQVDRAVLMGLMYPYRSDPAWAPVIGELFGKPEDWFETFQSTLADLVSAAGEDEAEDDGDDGDGEPGGADESEEAESPAAV